jgi:bifunctional UDP-N-acetylglucosamine pyrophosphorylase/glucosamine-1-phosphate N-acetyltransferase
MMSGALDITAIILAAGKGTRMKSSKAKVLHELFFAPMINHGVEAVLPLSLHDIVIVTGHQGSEVQSNLAEYEVDFARQEQQLGTGDAVLSAKNMVKDRSGTVLILCGDTPLVRTETLKEMIENHRAESAQITVMTTLLEDSTNYGRIITDQNGDVVRIVEEKDASDLERRIKEINAGIYCVDSSILFDMLAKVGTDNKQGEVYLTDIVSIAAESNNRVNKYVCRDSDEILGVNSRLELAKAAKVLQQRRNSELMLSGVSIMDPDSTFIDHKVEVGCDTIIFPSVFISGSSVIGERCVINPFVRMHNCSIDPDTNITSFSDLTGKMVD